MGAGASWLTAADRVPTGGAGIGAGSGASGQDAQGIAHRRGGNRRRANGLLRHRTGRDWPHGGAATPHIGFLKAGMHLGFRRGRDDDAGRGFG